MPSPSSAPSAASSLTTTTTTTSSGDAVWEESVAVSPGSALAQTAGLPAGSSISYVVGIQTVRKWGSSRSPADLVRIHVAVVHIPSVQSDVLITLNCPQPESEAAALFSQERQAAVFASVISSFHLKDLSLFTPTSSSI